MPFQAVPDAVLIALKGTLSGEQVVNTLGFKKVTPGIVTASELATILDGVVNEYVINIVQYFPEAYIYQGASGRVLDVQDGPVAENSVGQGTIGGRAGAVLPGNVSFCISFKTGLGGATNRGRNYVPGLTEPDVVGSLVDVTLAGDLVAGYASLMGAGTVRPGWIWSVISRKIIIPLVTGRAVPITQVVTNDLVVDSQRRRLPGRGA